MWSIFFVCGEWRASDFEAAGLFEDIEVIRQDAAMPVLRFTALLGIPCRTPLRWIAKGRPGTRQGPVVGPGGGCGRADRGEKYAQDWPALGHRKIHALMHADVTAFRRLMWSV